MNDYIHIRSDNLQDTIYVRRLIAFFPKEGYLLFEGYSNVTTKDLPHKKELIRYQPGIDYHPYFQIEIKEIHKKVIQEPPRPEIDHECLEDCDCNIQFFPLDIMILKFDLLIEDNHLPLTHWTFCVDSRFDTPTEMIQRYLQLVDVPDHHSDYQQHETDIEVDSEFYEGYHKEMNSYKDIYDSQYSIWRKPNHTLQQVDDKILTIFKEWTEWYDKITQKISSKYEHNDFLKDCHDFCEFLTIHSSFLQQWCSEFRCTQSFDEQLRGWLTYGIMSNHSLSHQEFQENWKLFFRKGDSTPDIIQLGDKEFDISYPHYTKLLEQKVKEFDLKYCDEEIKNIHKDKKCDGGGFYCFLCDEMESEWHIKVEKRYGSMNNIFISSEVSQLFIEKWLDAVHELSEKEKQRIHYIWPPPFTHSIDDILKKRHQLYYSYKVQPNVELEMIRDFQSILHHYRVPASINKNTKNRYNDIFLFLSQKIVHLSYEIWIDKKRCEELITIVNTLKST